MLKSVEAALIISIVDYSHGFNRQCVLLGVEPFIRNLGRKDLIQILITFFHNQKMKIKWNGIISSMRDLPGRGLKGRQQDY